MVLHTIVSNKEKIPTEISAGSFLLFVRRLSAVFREPFQTLCANLPEQSRADSADAKSLCAGMSGFEPERAVLETAMIPFHHIPICVCIISGLFH